LISGRRWLLTIWRSRTLPNQGRAHHNPALLHHHRTLLHAWHLSDTALAPSAPPHQAAMAFTPTTLRHQTQVLFSSTVVHAMKCSTAQHSTFIVILVILHELQPVRRSAVFFGTRSTLRGHVTHAIPLVQFLLPSPHRPLHACRLTANGPMS
jgi:hypothetical protein